MKTHPASIICKTCGHWFGRSTDCALVLADGTLVLSSVTLACRCGAERRWTPVTIPSASPAADPKMQPARR